MILKTLKKTTALTLVGGVLLYSSFSLIEPAFLQAQSASDTVQVTLDVDSGITITSPVDVVMSPNIGVVSDSSLGDVTWNVKTNDPDGYTLAVRASTNPAMRQVGIADFDDYTPATPGVPDAWSIGSGDFEFGYSAYGTHVNTATWGTGSSCGTGGVPAATQKWNGFTTSDFTVATDSNVTTTSGVDTTVCFAAAQNGVYVAAGTYTASITATATVQ